MKINFSLILPSRCRPQYLKKLLDSIYKKTKDLLSIEVLVCIDKDDPCFNEYIELSQQYKSFLLRMLMMDREKRLCAYYDIMAEKSSGKYVWALNDDCEIETENWDAMFLNKVEKHHSKIFYARIGGTGHKYYHSNLTGYSSGFPILSREAIDVLGYFYNPAFVSYHSEKYLHIVFNQSDAVIDMNDIGVKHKKGKAINDDTYKTMKKNSGVPKGINIEADITKIKNAIKKEQGAK